MSTATATTTDVMRETMRKAGRLTATKVTERDDGVTVMRYHDTDVVLVKRDAFVLQTGGYATVTTKRRMNQCMAPGWYVYQHKGTWYLQGPSVDSEPVAFDRSIMVTFRDDGDGCVVRSDIGRAAWRGWL